MLVHNYEYGIHYSGIMFISIKGRTGPKHILSGTYYCEMLKQGIMCDVILPLLHITLPIH